MSETKPIGGITQFSKLSLTHEEIGEWYLVKDMEGKVYPCLFWRNHKDKSFVTVVSDKQRFPTQVSLYPPKSFINSVVKFDPKELFDFFENGDSQRSDLTENDIEIDTISGEEISTQRVQETQHIEFENIHMEVDSPKILWDFRENMTKQLDLAVENYILENKKLNVGDKVKHIATGKIGLICKIIFLEDGVRYVGDLVRKDGGVSTNLLTTKKGNLFEELELIVEVKLPK